MKTCLFFKAQPGKSMRSLRVFATTVNPAEAGRIMGLKVAVRGFFRSLIKEGVFEKQIFFAQTNQPGRTLERLVSGLDLGKDEAARIEVMPLEQLPCRLKSDGIDVFSRQDCRINQYMNLRAIARRDCSAAITGITHSLNNAEEYAHLTEALLLSPTAKDAIVCTSSAAVEVLSRAFSLIKEGVPLLAKASCPRLVRIPLGIEDPPEPVPAKEARGAFGFEENSVVILYLGRIHSLVKAELRPLIVAFAAISRQRPDVKLVIAGGAEEKDSVEIELLRREIALRNLADKVQILQNLAEDRKWPLLCAADIFVSPVDNFQETFGLSIVEAMRAGLPVLCSDWGGYRDLVEHGVSGLLLPTCSFELPRQDAFFNPHLGYVPLELSQRVFVEMEAFRSSLARLVDEPGLRREMGAKGREKSFAFSWPRVIDSYAELWTELRNQSAPEAAGPRLELSQAALFASYPSRMLGDGSVLRIADHGTDKVNVPSPHPFLTPVLGRSVLEFVLNNIHDRVNVSVFSMAASGPFSAAELRLAASYLLKHGIIALG